MHQFPKLPTKPGQDMTDIETVVPFCTLATEDAPVPDVMPAEPMAGDRFAEMRSALAALVDTPLVAVEVHPLSRGLDRDDGIKLASASPLATCLGEFTVAVPKFAAAAQGGALYRMVVPAKFAEQVGTKLVRSMPSPAVPGGVGSALMGRSGIVGHASFVPVRTPGLVAIAAPLALNFVAAGLSMHAERQRQLVLENITQLLEELRDEALQQERDRLNGCRGAVDKAAAILFDGGEIGSSVGLGASASIINTAFETATRRASLWQGHLEGYGQGRIHPHALLRDFPGIDGDGGRFRTQLAIAQLAIALKKRLVVIQAAQHAQLNPTNPLKYFGRALASDQDDIRRLEARISDVMSGLGAVRLDRARGIRDRIALPTGDVDLILRTTDRLRELGPIQVDERQRDVAIEVAQYVDGSVTVYPAMIA